MRDSALAYDVVYDNVGTSSYPPQLSATINANAFPAIFTAPFLANGGIRPGSVPTGSNLTQAQARAATSTYVPDQVLPYSIQWNLGVQHQFAQDYTIEVRYLGTRGVHLLVQNQMFRFPLVTETRNLPTYLQAPSQAEVECSADDSAAVRNFRTASCGTQSDSRTARFCKQHHMVPADGQFGVSRAGHTADASFFAWDVDERCPYLESQY